MSGPATATVIPYRPRGAYKPKADDLRLELEAREAEEREWSEAIAPLVKRLHLLAQGPVATSTVAAIDAALTRHQRRWMPQPPEAA